MRGGATADPTTRPSGRRRAPSGTRRRDPRADLLTAARRLLRRHRRLTAAALAGIAVLLTVPVLRPPAPATLTLAVASRDLPGGSTLSAADVGTRDLPVTAVPPGAVTDPADLEGRVLSGPVLAGEPLTTTRLVGVESLASASRANLTADLVAAPVRIADSDAVALVRSGDLVDVVAASGAGLTQAQARVVAHRARVVTVPRRGESASGGLFSSGGGSPASTARGTLVVLAVPPATAVALAGAEATARLSLVLLPPPSAPPP